MAGVAIATALVPPVCAAGLSMSFGNLGVAYGALLLFVTNLIAIILASCFTYFMLGISSRRALPRHRRSLRLVILSLTISLAALIGLLSYDYSAQLHEGRHQTALYPLTRELNQTLHAFVAETDDVEIILLGLATLTGDVIIQLAAQQELPLSYADELRALSGKAWRSRIRRFSWPRSAGIGGVTRTR